MANEQNLKPFTGVDDPRNGRKPKGSKHLSTWIQEMLNDEDFQAKILEAGNPRDYIGVPVKAIVRVAMIKAIEGDAKWADWLAKYGYGTKVQLGNDPDNPLTNPDKLSDIDDRLKHILARGETGITDAPGSERPHTSQN